MAGNEDIDTTPPHDISNVLSAAEFSSQSSYDTANVYDRDRKSVVDIRLG